MAFIYLVTFSIVHVVDSKKRLRQFVDFTVLLMIYICLYSLTHRGRGSGGYFRDENDLCLYVVTMLPITYYLLMESKGLKKIIYGTGLVVGLMSVVVSFSRGGFLGFAAMGATIWLSSKNKIVTLIICIVLGGAVWFLLADDNYRTEMGTIGNQEDGTREERINSWIAGWNMFLDNPLGVGGNNFQVRFPEYQSGYFSRVMWGRVAHSLWFTLLPETGIIGVFLFLNLIVFNFKDILFVKRKTRLQTKKRNSRYLHALALSLLPAFVGFFVAASFISVLYYPFFWYMTGLTVALRRVYMQDELEVQAAYQ
jgi:O-antigen ligase